MILLRKHQQNFHLLRLFLKLSIMLVVDSKQTPRCYMVKVLGLWTTETPYYRQELKLHSNQTLSAVTRVLKEEPITVWNIQIVQRGKATAATTLGIWPMTYPFQTANQTGTNVLYNATYKTCEFCKYVRRISVFKNVVDTVLSKENSNLSLSCPLPVGTYVMRNIHVPTETGFLRYMFVPNAIYSLHNTVYSQRSDKSLEMKCTYEINATVLKTC